MTGAISRGLTLKDFDSLTLGQIIDYVITYNNKEPDDDDGEREATQADFDRFGF